MISLTFGEQVKIVLSRKDMTIKELAEEIEARTGKKMSRQNLTQRLGRDNFQEQDMRMIADILVDGAKPSETAVETFDNGTATVNTETCEALGLDFDTVKTAFEPLCTQVNEITTAESFDDVEAK